jgi:hypothetical protein
LIIDKKRVCIPCGFQLQYFFGKDTPQARKEVLSHFEYSFVLGRFIIHDPKGLVPKHAKNFIYHWPYAHEKWEEEAFMEDAQNWAQFLERKSTPSLTIFKATYLDQ